MAIKETTNPDGSKTVSATGQDKQALARVFDDTNAADRDTRMDRHASVKSRRVRNVHGNIVDVMEDKLTANVEVVDAQCGITMPANYLGFAEDGRIVYAERDNKDKWERACSRQGHEGWVICR